MEEKNKCPLCGCDTFKIKNKKLVCTNCNVELDKSTMLDEQVIELKKHIEEFVKNWKPKK